MLWFATPLTPIIPFGQVSHVGVDTIIESSVATIQLSFQHMVDRLVQRYILSFYFPKTFQKFKSFYILHSKSLVWLFANQ